MTLLAGIDIGGTKCAVALGRATAQSRVTESEVHILSRQAFLTPPAPDAALDQISEMLSRLIRENGNETPAAIGISCGGPLDSRKGVILSPPNLPGWGHVEATRVTQERFQVPVALQNDANAGALAEWQWGAGRGCGNIVFLTFGTGMGAGLILNGELYSGTNDMAGEVGHVRLEKDGPVGYGKAGSFEGFCSGGGIARRAQAMALEHLDRNEPCTFCKSREDVDSITAAQVAEAAAQGDLLAVEVFRLVAKQLGRGLAILVDLLNPQRVILGSIFVRQRALLEPLMLGALRSEALERSLSVCEIVPAGLGERVGDYASLAVALDLVRKCIKPLSKP